MLCRKYGGASVASHAARVIQHAYRRYRLDRSFARMRLEVAAFASSSPSLSSERRLSRRFAEYHQHAGSSAAQTALNGHALRPLPELSSVTSSVDLPSGVCCRVRPCDVPLSDAYMPATPVSAVRWAELDRRAASRLLCTRVAVRKSHSVQHWTTTTTTTTLTAADERQVDGRRATAAAAAARCCVQPDTASVASTDDVPARPAVAVVVRHHERCTDPSRGASTPRQQSDDELDMVDALTDVDDAALDETGGDTDAAAAATDYETFQQLCLTDSSYGAVTATEPDSDSDNDHDTAENLAPPVASHIYSSLRLCNSRHSSSASAQHYQQSVDPDTRSDDEPLPPLPPPPPPRAGSVISCDSPVWKRKEAGADGGSHGTTAVRCAGCGWRGQSAPQLYNEDVLSDSGSGSVTRSTASLACSETTSSASTDTISHLPTSASATLTRGGGVPSASRLYDGVAQSSNLVERRTCQRHPAKISDKQRKRTYRIGLNLFNKKPENGVRYLVQHRFLDYRPNAVARFLITRKGLSKLMIGEYLGNLQKPFNAQVLAHFTAEVDLTGLQVDVALRKFQSYFRMPGEAQKIERLMEAFADRYCECNREFISRFQRPDTVFLLAFAIVMLNTDLHNSSIKAERKMKLNDFIWNLRGIDGGEDVDAELLTGIYERVRASEFQPSTDHVLQVVKVEQKIVGKKPQLALLHRRLVCYCRLYEVADMSRKEKPGSHQREVFLFNDMIMVTKILGKRKNAVTYSFRCSFSLYKVSVQLFETPCYKYGFRLTSLTSNKVLLTLNARNEHDRNRFVDDLREAILEVSEMEDLRIEEELERQNCQLKHSTNAGSGSSMASGSGNVNRYSKDSGVVDIELLKPPLSAELAAAGGGGGAAVSGQRSCLDSDQGLGADSAASHAGSQHDGSLAVNSDGEHNCSAGSLDSGLVSIHS